MKRERVLIVEDEPAVARGLEYALKQEGFEVFWAKTGAQALEMTKREQPDLITLDLRLPDMSGYDVCRALRSQSHRQPILMLTARDEELDKVLGLELGADDYMVKPYGLRELVSRIRALLRRAYGELAAQSDTQVHRFEDLEIDLTHLEVRLEGEIVELTPTEFRLLHYLAARPNVPVSRSGLVEAVWGYEGDVNSDRTVDVHIRHLRQKIERDAANPTKLVTVRGFGYKFQS
ncbi:MAG: response regulator transcription factor [Caldilineaceae bacterium]|nr:response regulator transcription factor [Caldilineaceae bacterium]MDE0200532.1 response regulator transcription factor [Caldilineaceae bacterium]MDE0463609.1 response regulator transcription factor [Caldilineaceae bacterium]MXX24157.1 response regulator transcription factor [Caldilineaceae bacterium SB0668_bin_21]MYC21611.1 response regulator transcription factor [Caldilineaceae bacterium SB0662_bin_25]